MSAKGSRPTATRSATWPGAADPRSGRPSALAASLVALANACIGAERADLVLAGCAILDAMRRAFPCRRLRVADRGLREGMLVQMRRADGVWNGGGGGGGGGGEARAP